MPDYVLLSDLSAKIPGVFVVQALDDDGDGIADPGVWDSIKADVEKEINGTLGKRFAVPFSNPVPAVVLSTAVVLARSALYERRGIPDKENPFAKARDDARKELKAIAAGEHPLTPDIQRKAPAVSIIGEPAKTQSSTGSLTV